MQRQFSINKNFLDPQHSGSSVLTSGQGFNKLNLEGSGVSGLSYASNTITYTITGGGDTSGLAEKDAPFVLWEANAEYTSAKLMTDELKKRFLL